MVMDGTVYVLVTDTQGNSREWFLSPEEFETLTFPRDADNYVAAN